MKVKSLALSISPTEDYTYRRAISNTFTHQPHIHAPASRTATPFHSIPSQSPNPHHLVPREFLPLGSLPPSPFHPATGIHALSANHTPQPPDTPERR